MVQSNIEFSTFSTLQHGSHSMIGDEVLIEELSPEDEQTVADLIRRNLANYEESGNVLASTWRRLENFYEHYSSDGRRFFVARDPQKGRLIGAAGLGSLHGLPASEGLGEIRDLVVDKDYRGRGLGKRILRRAIEKAREFGYKRLYLETTPQMENAKKLFMRFGFRPVEEAKSEGQKKDPKAALPGYFLLEDLSLDRDKS